VLNDSIKMDNTLPAAEEALNFKLVNPPPELNYLAAVCQMQETFQNTTPANRFFSSKFSALVSSERIRKATSFLNCANSSLKHYNEALEEFQTNNYLNVFDGQSLCKKRVGDPIQLKGFDDLYKIDTILHALPYDGATGVVLKSEGGTHGSFKIDKYVVCFRSAIETASFIKVGMSGMASGGHNWSKNAKANRFLSELYLEYAPSIKKAIVTNWKPGSTIVFLGFSMGAALAQLCMYDLLVNERLVCTASHLLLASPRIANEAFYKDLAVSKTPTLITTYLTAVNYRGSIYMDPVPLLDCFEDPPQRFVLGDLRTSQEVWHTNILDATASYGSRFPVQVYKKTGRNYRCSPVSVFGSFVGSMLTGTAIDLHNLGYFNIAYHGDLFSNEDLSDEA
jgi:hypothetical protein